MVVYNLEQHITVICFFYDKLRSQRERSNMDDQRWQCSDKTGNKQETVSYIMRGWRSHNDCWVPEERGSSLPIVAARSAGNSKCIPIAPPQRRHKTTAQILSCRIQSMSTQDQISRKLFPLVIIFTQFEKQATQLYNKKVRNYLQCYIIQTYNKLAIGHFNMITVSR